MAFPVLAEAKLLLDNYVRRILVKFDCASAEVVSPKRPVIIEDVKYKRWIHIDIVYAMLHHAVLKLERFVEYGVQVVVDYPSLLVAWCGVPDPNERVRCSVRVSRWQILALVDICSDFHRHWGLFYVFSP